jgi:PKD repeat protein
MGARRTIATTGKALGCGSWLRTLAPWIALLSAAAFIAFAPARIAAQDQEQEQGEAEGPSPMPTPEILPLPSLGLYADPSTGTAPLVVGFVPEIHDPAGAEIVSYKWNFGDGHFATTPPLITYNTYVNPGVYVASLTITTADGRSATGFASVNVAAPAS